VNDTVSVTAAPTLAAANLFVFVRTRDVMKPP